MSGSSPPARGLQARRLPPHRRLGIIPARAGFTAFGPCGGLSLRDHPRPRGVYTGPPPPWGGSFGSSPPARGLRRPLPRGLRLGRIIPARAGFTAAAAACPVDNRDHPRPRGVYHGAGRVSWAAWRIIPARAGFTARPPRPPTPATDHPRPRGVYAGLVGQSRFVQGSSPPARGLRRLAHLGRARRRIIPARAGFTARWCWRGTATADHPRPRGVYRVACGGRVDLQGSSPPARGLRVSVRAAWKVRGIIPARAGFTSW